MASKLGMLGSIDANTGSPDLGWDTDQFPMDVKNATFIMKVSNRVQAYSCCKSMVKMVADCAHTNGTISSYYESLSMLE